MNEKQSDRPGFQPLYQQVRELLLARIASGAWRPAEALPSEHALAAELGVSQGTVRKALDALAAESVLERRQGKGTYVTQHTTESAQFRFFRLYFDDTNTRVLPTSKASTITKQKPSEHTRHKLKLAKNTDVFRISRTRYADDRPVLREEIFVSSKRMPSLDTFHPLPNTLYTFYQHHFDSTVVSASEQLKAVAADKRVAKSLQIEPGAPLLVVERIAYDLKETPVEYRHTYYLTAFANYQLELT